MKERPVPFMGREVRATLDGRQSQFRRIVKPQPTCPDHGAECPDLSFERCDWKSGPVWTDGWNGYVRCPYGVPGDSTWRQGMPPADGWYHVQGWEEPVFLRRFVPGPRDGDAEPGVLWGRNESDDPEAIEIEGLSLDTLRWRRHGDLLWVRSQWWHYEPPPASAGNEQAWDKWTRTVRWPSGEAIEDCEPELDDRWRRRPSIHMPRWASRIDLEVTGVRAERLQEISEGDAVAEGCPEQEWYRVDGGPSHWFKTAWDALNGKRAPWSSNPWVWVVEFERIKP